MSDAPLVETDAGGLLDALDRAVRMRRAGVRFEVAFRFPNDRATVANLAASDVIAKTRDASTRRRALDDLASYDARLGSAVLENLSTMGVPERKAAHDLWALADAVRISSFAEYRRLMIGLDYAGPRRLHEPADARVPLPAGHDAGGRSRDRTLVWAPTLRTDAFLLALAGACADGAPVDVVCAGGETYDLACSIVPPSDAAAALGRSGIIVSVGENPGTATALAAWGRPVCAPEPAGAQLWLRGITTYRPWSSLDLERAIGIARASTGAFERILPPLRTATPIVDAESSAGVCVIVRKQGDELSRPTSNALARLCHRHVEIALVDPEAALEPTLRETHAEYAYVIDDGDAPFAEALSRLCALLDSSGDDAATGDTLATYVTATDPFAVIGYALMVTTRDERTIDDVPLRTLVRRSRIARGALGTSLSLRVDATLATVHRTLDGRSPFLPSLRARPNRLPGLRFDPPRPLEV